MSAYSIEELHGKKLSWLMEKRGLGPKLSASTHQRIEQELLRRGMENIPPIPSLPVVLDKPLSATRFKKVFIFLIIFFTTTIISAFVRAGGLAMSMIFLSICITAFFLLRNPNKNERSQALINGQAHGVTELMLVAADGDIPRARDLLNYGVAIDDATKSGLTALMYASANGQQEMCSLLLEYKADKKRCSKSGKSPADIAREKGHLSLADDLSHS